jgi:two-component system, NarL family, response regulator DegU
MSQTNDRRITLIIADDHPLFRSGVRHELEFVPELSVLAETGDGEEALQLIAKHRPDVAVVDYEMPGLTGLEIAKRVDAAGYSTAVVLLTMHRNKQIFFAALEAGVSGYVLKDDAVSDIVNAVKYVVTGDNFVSRDLTKYLIEKASIRVTDDPVNGLLQTLTEMERKVLALISDFKTNGDIADTLFLSKRTVENYKTNIAGKLNLRTAKQLLRFALENKDKLQ